MLIIFKCDNCGKRFQLDERMRGRRGRCSNCGHVMRIPQAGAANEPVHAPAAAADGHDVRMPAPQERHAVEHRHDLEHQHAPAPEPEPQPAAPFRLSPPEPPPLFVPPAAIHVESAEAERSPDAPRLVGPHDSVFALGPVAHGVHPHHRAEGHAHFELLDDDDAPGAAGAASPEIERAVRELAEFEKDPRGYSLAGHGGGVFRLFRLGDSGPASWVLVKWRSAVGKVLKVLRWVDSWAYIISVPFVVLMIFGIVVESTKLVHLGAVIVVLANYGRFWTDLLAFFVRPFKDGPHQGLMFLFPPFTAYYIWRHWGAMKPILRRIATSCIPIVLVVLVYAFVPFVNPAAKEAKTVTGKVESGAKEVVREIDRSLEELGTEVRRHAGPMKGAARSPSQESTTPVAPGPEKAD